jgi:hypothetical protein
MFERSYFNPTREYTRPLPKESDIFTRVPPSSQLRTLAVVAITINN